MSAQLKFLATHITEIPEEIETSSEKVRVDYDGEICFSSDTEHDFHPVGILTAEKNKEITELYWEDGIDPNSTLGEYFQLSDVLEYRKNVLGLGIVVQENQQ